MYITNTTFLFVYGTLLEKSNNDMSKFLNAHAEFVGKGYFNGKLYDVEEYPGAVLSKNINDKVYGSIYEISNAEKVFKVLDAYEGIDLPQTNNDLFKRVVVEAFYEGGRTVKTWVYIYNQPFHHLRLISSGRFIED